MTTRKTAPAEKKPATATPQSALPLFYDKPTLLEGGKHGDLGVAKDMSYTFAGKVNALPINLVEFPQAAHYYPIAFARDAAATPVAIVGVRDNENLFVDADGKWKTETYVPAYIRRYPFILSESPDGQQLSLCIEDAPGVLDPNSPDKLFDAEKQPTQLAKNAMEFCRSYHVAAKQTALFSQALADEGLLVERSAELSLRNGQRVSFSGFRILDEEKFNKIPEKLLADWRSKGWLAGAYAHLFSGLHWGSITRLLNDRIQ